MMDTVVERENALMADGAEAEAPIRVCFVCTGNTCRSPMAAAVLNELGNGRYAAMSAGISANVGESIAVNAVKALEKAGIRCTADNDYASHRAIQIDELMIRSCDRIIAMTGSHFISLIMLTDPKDAKKIECMPNDIPDPYMGSEAEYERCLEAITHGIKELFAL